jgi:hypothetical protein
MHAPNRRKVRNEMKNSSSGGGSLHCRNSVDGGGVRSFMEKRARARAQSERVATSSSRQAPNQTHSLHQPLVEPLPGASRGTRRRNKGGV